jgi:hypothetical protein
MRACPTHKHTYTYTQRSSCACIIDSHYVYTHPHTRILNAHTYTHTHIHSRDSSERSRYSIDVNDVETLTERIKYHAKRKSAAIDMERRRQEYEELRECTFTPAIHHTPPKQAAGPVIVSLCVIVSFCTNSLLCICTYSYRHTL